MVEITENRYQSDLLALIYGFSQDGSSKFTGSLKYMQKWLQCSRTTAVKTADQLVASGLILKDSETINGVTFNRYSVDLERVKNMRTGGTPEVRGGTSGVRGGTRGVSNNTNYIPIDNTNYKIKQLQFPSTIQGYLSLSIPLRNDLVWYDKKLGKILLHLQTYIQDLSSLPT